MLIIYCDGACRGNGKDNSRGGWAYAILQGDILLSRGSGGEKNTTNQRMELQAAIEGIQAARRNFPLSQIEIFTDSAYLCNCFTQNWWKAWEKNDWVNSKKEPVANQDLWKILVAWFSEGNIKISKVRGHCNVPLNEMVDKMACAAADKLK